MQAPEFWYRSQASLSAKLLSPLAAIYAAITGTRFKSTTPHQAKVPVVCVGNFTMGGAGKTPLTLNLYTLLQAKGFKPCILSRGYGGETLGPHLVSIKADTAKTVGDEPYMMAASCPVVISRDRVAGSTFIEKKGFDLILMDDGFQNPSLTKDLSILAVDGKVMLGNSKVFPAGPLREPMARALSRTDAIVIIGTTAEKVETKGAFSFKGPIFNATLQPKARIELPPKAIGFCGIGRPSKFYTTLKDLNVELIKTVDFQDHHPYSLQDLEKLETLSTKLDTPLVTTEKDWVKLPKEWQTKIQYLPISLQWDTPTEIENFLNDQLGSKV